MSMFGNQGRRVESVTEAFDRFASMATSPRTIAAALQLLEEVQDNQGLPELRITLSIRRDIRAPGMLSARIDTRMNRLLGEESYHGLNKA